jgi:hypothetical protein
MQTNGNHDNGNASRLALSAEQVDRIVGANTVYVREVDVVELKGSGLLPADAAIPAAQKFFALHAADGRRMAVLDDRDLAFAAAREHELAPVSVH